MEYIGTKEISDDKFRSKDYFLLDTIGGALEADAVASSHPLSFSIDKAAEVYEAFDSITYDKGASILTMLQALIGEDNFRQAITRYIKKFSYNNAQASDLWEVFDEHVKNITGPDGSPMKTTEFAYQWTTQLRLSLLSSQNLPCLLSIPDASYSQCFERSSQRLLKANARRYNKKNKDAQELEKYRHPKYGFKWDIPLWYQEHDKQVERTWLNREEPLYLHVSNTDKPVVVNADRHGFYRQNYDRYIKKFSYNNAQASDLWEVFDEHVKNITGPDGSPMKTTEFAYQWTTQMGFPTVTVESFNATTLKVTQRRYKKNKDAQELEKYRHPKY
ncbi:hypothetical protein COOONC_14842, partial [Cooperia oncophora]